MQTENQGENNQSVGDSAPTQETTSIEEPVVIASANPPVENQAVDGSEFQTGGDESGSMGPAEYDARKPLEALKTVIQEFNVLVDDAKKPGGSYLILPGSTWEKIVQVLRSLPNYKPELNEELVEWARALAGGLELVSPNMQYSKSVSRENAEWAQTVNDASGTKLSMARPRFNYAEGAALTGEKAIMRMRSALGLGNTFAVPLWHSGFWVTFKNPGDAALMELEQRISQEKVILGRQTSGAVLSNQTVYLVSHILDLAVDSIHDCTLATKDYDNILSMVSVHDIPLLIWGFACTIWPNGYDYQRAVISADGTGDRIAKERISLQKLLWTDRRALHADNIRQMSNRVNTTVTLEHIREYQSKLLVSQKSSVTYTGSAEPVTFNLAVPMASDYINSGHAWILELIQATDRVLGYNADEEARNRYIFRQASTAMMRNYAHWVESIEIGETGVGNIIKEREAVNNTLATCSADADFGRWFVAEIRKFLDNSVVSLIAVPTVEGEQENVYPRWPHLVPISPESTFFTLLGLLMAEKYPNT